MKRLSMLLGCLLLSVPSYAQTCLGQVSFATAPTQAGAGVAFSSNSQNFLGDVAIGSDKWFGRGGVELTKVSDLPGTGKGFVVQAGLNVPMASYPRLHVCPIVQLADSFGYHPAPDINASELLFGFGGTVGYELPQSGGNVKIVPTAGLNIDHSRMSFGGFGGSFGDNFGNLQAGVGLLLKQETLAITPALVIPFGLEGADTSFVVTLTTKIR